MSSVKPEKIKYKLLSFDELVINLDRLSRFKLPEESFPRVFNSVLYKCLIYPKYSKNELENLSAEDISKLVKIIWNKSVEKISAKSINSEANKSLKILINSVFTNISPSVKKLINTELAISTILEKIDYNSAPLNLKLLISANKTFNEKNPVSPEKINDLRIKYKLKFPIKKLLIVEGITEEILLPVFATKMNADFDENGIYILGAGGKSKSPDIYMKLRDKLKIPVVLLFDSDAFEICKILQKVLLKKDKTIIIEKGEFEDILSKNLIKRSLNSEYDIVNPLSMKDLNIHSRMCLNIEEFYRTRKIGEYKKSKFSKITAKNIKYSSDITDDIKDIINKII